MSIQASIIKGNVLDTGYSAFGELLCVTPTPIAGWNFTYNINTDMVTPDTSGMGTVTQSNGFAVLSTGAAANSYAKIKTRRNLRYINGQGGAVKFTAIFDTPLADNVQEIGLSTDDNGFLFGYDSNGDFGVIRRSNGTDVFTAQADWNINKMPSLNPRLLNVYSIVYQWLGGGAIAYAIEEPYTGKLTIVHVDRYANTSVSTSIRNPTLPMYARCFNLDGGNDSDVVLQTPSGMAFAQGPRLNPEPVDPLGFSRAFNNDVSLGMGSEDHIITIGMESTYQGIDNRLLADLRFLTLSTLGSKPVLFNMYRNATITAPNWTDYNLNISSLRSDVDATISGGSLVTSFTLSSDDALALDMDTFDVRINKTDTITITAISDTSNDVRATLNFMELF